MTCGNTYNQTAKEITKAKRQQVRGRSRLYALWIDQGYDRVMPFTEYVKKHGKRFYNEWQSKSWQKKIPKTHFKTGKYQNYNIGIVFKKDLGYISWLLENQPDSDLSKQVVAYVNQNPSILDTQRHKSPLCVAETKTVSISR